jgi:4-amino-4-deoxy-L-arabinose transferase-like glycosyltransferase
LAVAIALLLKGPIGFVLPAAVVVVVMLARRASEGVFALAGASG